jgi:energy-coupling factor transporter ATP-binding protein EcfA2
MGSKKDIARLRMPKYRIDQLRESMVKILDPGKPTIAGSGFIIHPDGYLVTCHHVIFLMNQLKVEYRGKPYDAIWCPGYSNIEVDIAILKIGVENATAVPIANPGDLQTPLIIYGFPQSKSVQFPDGFDVPAQDIHPSAPINTLSTYRHRKTIFNSQWNKLPQAKSTFHSHRIDAKMEPGMSGGPVFAEELGGVVGVIQCSASNVSYAIRWDNILEALIQLKLEPERNAVLQFLEDIENHDDLKYMKLFHSPAKIVVEKQYIPIDVTLERRYRHEVESLRGYAESEEELKHAYALKGIEDQSSSREAPWEEVKKDADRIMVLADPGMGKSTLLRMEARLTVQRERQAVTDDTKAQDKVIFPLYMRLSDLDKQEGEVFDVVQDLAYREFPRTSEAIAPLLREKLKSGKCLLLLDALDEVPREHRKQLSERLLRFTRNYPCPIICTSRIVGYSGAFLEDAKEMEIIPFREERVEQYIKTWFTNAAASIEDDSVSAEGLVQELRNKPQIGGLAQNPLLLSLICSLYQEKNLSLPARRVHIYERAVDCILSKWSQRRRELSRGRIIAKARLLEEVAYQFSCEDKQIFSDDELYDGIEEYLQGEKVETAFKDSKTEELITELSEEDGIIQISDREGQWYLFLHRTFQEYFSASRLKRAIEKSQRGGIELVRAYLWDYDWHETISLVAGMMKDPVPLLQAIMGEKDDIFSSLLILTGRCIAEAEKIPHPLIAEVTNKIYELWQSYPYFDFISSTFTALGQANPEVTVKLSKDLNDEDSSVRERAAEALGKIPQ